MQIADLEKKCEKLINNMRTIEGYLIMYNCTTNEECQDTLAIEKLARETLKEIGECDE